MKQDSRLSSILHLLLHMAYSPRALTSDALAGYLSTHAVVVRRTLAGLRDLGYVRSEKGHGGGWTLACDLQQVSLRDIYVAVGSPTLLAIGPRTEHPHCVVEQAVNAAVADASAAAEAVLLQRLGAVTLAQLSADFNQRMAVRALPEHLHAHTHPSP